MFPDITSLKTGDLSPLSKLQKDTEGRSANIPKAFPFFLKALRVKVYTKRVPEISIVADAWSSDLFGSGV